MRLHRFFLVTFAFFLLLWAFVGFADSTAEVQRINLEIEELQQVKGGFESRALWHENQASYLQFDQQANLETRRHLQIAQENRDKAAFIQQRIDQLEIQRAKLQK